MFDTVHIMFCFIFYFICKGHKFVSHSLLHLQSLMHISPEFMHLHQPGHPFSGLQPHLTNSHSTSDASCNSVQFGM